MINKGSYQYMKKRRKREILKTILFFGISFAIFLTGYITTKSRNNLMTLVAVLGVLPASKSAVGMIMFLRFPAISDQLYKLTQPFEGSFTILYDLIFTSREAAMKLDCLVICDNTIIGYSVQKKLLDAETAKYLKNFLSNHGKGKVNIKIYTTEKSFIERLKTLSHLNQEKADKAELSEHKIKELLLSFSM